MEYSRPMVLCRVNSTALIYGGPGLSLSIYIYMCVSASKLPIWGVFIPRLGCPVSSLQLVLFQVWQVWGYRCFGRPVSVEGKKKHVHETLTHKVNDDILFKLTHVYIYIYIYAYVSMCLFNRDA